MPLNTMTYDEETALTDYVWKHHSSLLTEEELMVGRVILGMGMANKASSEQVELRIREKWGIAWNDPVVVAALADGVRPTIFNWRDVTSRLV